MHSNIPGRPRIELPAYYESFAWYYPNCEMQTKHWFVEYAAKDWVYLDCGAKRRKTNRCCWSLNPFA